MTRFDQTCPYCQQTLPSLSEVYCPHCGVILKGNQKELDQARILSLYQQADMHFQDEEWSDGIYLLIDALRLQPDSQETQNRLKDARHQFRLARLYEWAEEHYFAGHYDEALEHLEEIESEVPAYRDVQEMIERIDEEKGKKRSKKKRIKRWRNFFNLSIQWSYIFLICVFILVIVTALFLMLGLVR